MAIYLGNLTTKQMEKRLGIELTDEERSELDACREETCNRVAGNDVWHCYDLPFEMVVGSRAMAGKALEILGPYSDKMVCPLRVSADYGK